MRGHVDESARALLDIAVSADIAGTYQRVATWVDTAFDGQLVFSNDLIADLGLETLVQTEAVLADGSKVTLETYLCYMDWFGDQIPVQVIANEGRLPLLGTGLLDDHVLHVDYIGREVSLN